ncbi:MAG: hypothetical protein FJ241_12015 [Nitrospira sp.]|nr:hypothetical protein [Nitrospira sp.]
MNAICQGENTINLQAKTYKIHPIVMGTKAFDKGMMTYQNDYGNPYTIPIYCWYIDGVWISVPQK